MIMTKDCHLFRTDTCFVLGIRKHDVIKIVCTPLDLECGEVLRPGEGFTQIGTSGYSANPNIHMAEGWTQRYIGLIKHHHPKGPATLAVFKAFDSFGVSAFAAREKSERHKGFEWFIAYAWSPETKSFCFWSQALSFRWINTDKVVRAV